MQTAVPLACFLSIIRPPGVQYENALLQIAPVDKSKCPYVKDNNDVGFQLFTRHNPTAYQELVLGDDEKLFASNMDYNDKTVIYFHAWMEQPDDGSGLMIREAFMQRGDTNVIMVDARSLEAGPWYFTAAQNTWYIGRFAAQFIDYLASRGLNLNNTQLIGHSLGAQAAGVAGSALKSGRVARITGLDPALPLFDNLPLEQRLDTTDAGFVDIVHTDAGIFGYKAPMGHVDFYPNGGISPQPGCELEVVIPKQLLLNKCDSRTQTLGFYSYYLTSNQKTHSKPKTLESKLENLFDFIQSFKDKDGRNVNFKKTNDNVANRHKINIEYDHIDFTSINNANNTSDDVTIQKDTNKTNTGLRPNDSIKDILTQENRNKPDEYFEDQIAEASEYDMTQIELNQGTLKDKETLSLIKESEEFVLKDGESITERNHTVLDIGVKETPELYKATETERTTTFSLIDAESTKASEDIRETRQTNSKYTSNIDTLNYKDPCELKKVSNNFETKESNQKQTSVKETEVLPIDIKNRKKSKPKPKINILNILGNTYRISRVISTFKKHKDKTLSDKLKNLFDDGVSTTPRNLLKNIKNLDFRTKNHVVKRQKRFLPFFKRSDENESNNILFKMLDFLIKNRKNVLPVFTVMREINTLVKSANGELNHITKEQNNYIGATPPTFAPISYTLELGNESKAMAFIKRLLGMSPKGDRLSISGRK